jgi:SAM-dependent methyltransferase
MRMTAEQTLYEQLQNQNWLTRFLHSGRYAELLATVGRMERELGRPVRVLDIGCGPGATAKTLLDHYDADYTGIDNDPVFIAAAEAKTGSRANCRFLTADAADPGHYRAGSADLVCALETFEHIPANSVVQIVENVCRIVKPRVFLVTVPVEVGPAVWIKNWGSLLMGYDRKSGNLRETFWAGLYRLQRVPPHDVSHQGFDWRWLAYTMHSNSPLQELRSMPFRFIPRSLAPTMLMVSRPGG